MSENLSIPKHWQLVRVGEYVISVKGKKPKKISPVKTLEFSIPYVNIKAFEKNVIDEYTDGVGCVLCDEGDFLMVWDGSRSGYVGKAIKGALGSTLVKLKFPNIDTNYAYYFLQSKYIEINTRAKGVGIPHVDPSLLWNYNLPIPPLKEQAAIVSKIEELLSDLENGKKQLIIVQEQLKVYRQSLLKLAFEGRLTNKNLNGALPKGWKIVKSGEIIDTINNGYTPTKEDHPDGKGEIPFIKVYNLNFDGTLNFRKDPTFIPNSIHKKELKRSICFPNDVLINIVGPPLGKVSIVSNQYPEWNINQAIVLFRPNKKILSKYISYFLQNPVTINWLEDTSKATAGQWNVKVSTCRLIPIPIPPIEEQQHIVDELESKLTVCNKIEETISNSLQQIDTLKQSILKKAFEGRLV